MRLTFVGCGDAFSSGGRFHTCLKVDAAGQTALVDIGASAMLALTRSGTDPNGVGAILLTHFHGDHFGGLPFFLLDALFVGRRVAPLTVAGPKGVEARCRGLMEALYPGVLEKHARFDLRFVEVSPGAPAVLGALAVEAFPMVHDEAAGPCQGYRIGVEGRVLAFTGDTGWTEALIPLAAGADLFVSECCFVDRTLPNHLDWRRIEAELPRLTSRRTVLTHMGPDMLAFDGPMFAKKAFDGMEIDV